MAAHIPWRIKQPRIGRRLERLVDKGAVRVRRWYEPIAGRLIQAASVTGEIALVWASTKVSAHHRLVLVGIAYRQRVIPLAWTWVRSSRGHGSTKLQRARLRYVRSLLPSSLRVRLVGDCAFGHMVLVSALQDWGWDYVLRQSGQPLVDVASQPDWLRLDALIQRGQWHLLSAGYLTLPHQLPTHLLLTWKQRYPSPWLLATNLTNPRLILRLYHRRLWLEQTLGDLKANGFDLERAALKHFLRLSRLTRAVMLLYGWFLAFGADQVQRGFGAQVDRADRRDLSLFRIAWDSLQRTRLFDLPLSVSFQPLFGPLPDFRPCGW